MPRKANPMPPNYSPCCPKAAITHSSSPSAQHHCTSKHYIYLQRQCMLCCHTQGQNLHLTFTDLHALLPIIALPMNSLKGSSKALHTHYMRYNAIVMQWQLLQEPHILHLYNQRIRAMHVLRCILWLLCRLLKAAGVEGLPSLSSKGDTGCKAFIADQNSWWEHHTNCLTFSKRSERSKRTFHHQVQTDGVSVSVLMFQPHAVSVDASSTTPLAPPASKKRRRQEQNSNEWVQGLPDRYLDQPQRVVGVDPGRKALFTAVVHSQQAAESLQSAHPCEHKYESLSWSCSRWQEAAGIKYRLHKTKLWISRDAGLNAALLATPTAKVATSAEFLHHVRHRMQHTTAAQTHFGDRRHRQLRWRSFIKRQQAYSAICKEISGGSSDTVVAYGDAKFSSSCCKGNPSTPTVSLRSQLGHSCKVFDTDEFRTSKLCCACKTAMDGMRLPLSGNIMC